MKKMLEFLNQTGNIKNRLCPGLVFRA